MSGNLHGLRVCQGDIPEWRIPGRAFYAPAAADGMPYHKWYKARCAELFKRNRWILEVKSLDRPHCRRHDKPCTPFYVTQEFTIGRRYRSVVRTWTCGECFAEAAAATLLLRDDWMERLGVIGITRACAHCGRRFRIQDARTLYCNGRCKQNAQRARGRARDARAMLKEA